MPGPTFLNIDRTGYSVCVHRVSRTEEGRESGDSAVEQVGGGKLFYKSKIGIGQFLSDNSKKETVN